MSLEELDGWEEAFYAFHGRFARLFARSESRLQAAKYMCGLLGPVERKNGWQVAEGVGDRRPDATQRLLYQVEWDAEGARDILQEFIVEHFGEKDAIGVLDETGFIKKGEHSAGVQRQYSGTAGKMENCQIGVFLSYASKKGHALLDRRLYLPESWCDDKERRKGAKLPDEVVFQTKPQQGIEMLRHAWKQGVPMRWVTGDEVYGNDPELRRVVSESGRWYVLAVSSTAPAWLSQPEVLEPEPRATKKGRPRKRRCLAPDAPAPTPVKDVVAAFAEQRWERFAVADGEKGPRFYDWAYERVVENRQGLPGEEVWLLARRSISDPKEIAYYLSNAPKSAALPELAQVAATRYTVEQCFEEAKGETGLDHYEVRYWHSWYRHITLSMMAHAFLSVTRSQAADKKGP